MPNFNQSTNLIHASRVSLGKVGRVGKGMILFLELFGLVQVNRDKNGVMVDCNNLTLINLVLVKFGPLREDWACLYVLGVQIAACLLTFVVRGVVADSFYSYNNKARVDLCWWRSPALHPYLLYMSDKDSGSLTQFPILDDASLIDESSKPAEKIAIKELYQESFSQLSTSIKCDLLDAVKDLDGLMHLCNGAQQRYKQMAKDGGDLVIKATELGDLCLSAFDMQMQSWNPLFTILPI